MPLPVPTKSGMCLWSVTAVQIESKLNQKDHGGKDLWNKWVLSLKWKAGEVVDGEIKDRDCVWGDVQDEVNQDESEHNVVDRTKKRADSTIHR